jgi:hypothetical protein
MIFAVSMRCHLTVDPFFQPTPINEKKKQLADLLIF